MSYPAISVSSTDRYPVTLSHLPLAGRGEIRVLREDLLAGGTKSRALKPFLRELAEQGYRAFGYASPFAGFAQVALSYACQELGLDCRLFAQLDPKTGRAHPLTIEAARAGAQVSFESTLPAAELACARWENGSRNRMKVPLGLDCEGYRAHLGAAIVDVWGEILCRLRSAPPRVWVSIGSGTLVGALRRDLPSSVEIFGVDVRVLARDDSRLERVRRLERFKYFAAPMPFSDESAEPAPVPSNRNYDAKVWPFLAEWGNDGDLWWNVAR